MRIHFILYRIPRQICPANQKFQATFSIILLPFWAPNFFLSWNFFLDTNQSPDVVRATGLEPARFPTGS